MKRWKDKPILSCPTSYMLQLWPSFQCRVVGEIEHDRFVETIDTGFGTREEAIAFIESIPLRPTDSPGVGVEENLGGDTKK